MRKRTPKPIERRIEIFVAGRKMKTVKTKLTARQATRETGEDRFFTRGDTMRMRRKIGSYLTVVVTWTAKESMIDMTTHAITVNTQDAVMVARKGMVL